MNEEESIEQASSLTEKHAEAYKLGQGEEWLGVFSGKEPHKQKVAPLTPEYYIQLAQSLQELSERYENIRLSPQINIHTKEANPDGTLTVIGTPTPTERERLNSTSRERSKKST